MCVCFPEADLCDRSLLNYIKEERSQKRVVLDLRVFIGITF